MKKLFPFAATSVIVALLLLFSCKKLQSTDTAPPASPPSLTCGTSNRPIVNATLVPIGTLAHRGAFIPVAAGGTKIFFAGGQTQEAPPYMSGQLVILAARIKIHFKVKKFSPPAKRHIHAVVFTVLMDNNTFMLLSRMIRNDNLLMILYH